MVATTVSVLVHAQRIAQLMTDNEPENVVSILSANA
jgi:hypothetical protein